MNMTIVRGLLIAILAFLAILPNLVSTMVWGPLNVAFAALVVGLMIAMAVKTPQVAKWAIVPLAAIITLPPYPYWLFVDDSGNYKLVFNVDGLNDSLSFFAALFLAYTVVFALIWLIARHRPKRSAATIDS